MGRAGRRGVRRAEQGVGRREQRPATLLIDQIEGAAAMGSATGADLESARDGVLSERPLPSFNYQNGSGLIQG